VLIVDDDPIVGQALREDLEEAGYRTLVVESGPACLECLGRESVDLVLLDLMMPEMSGLEVLDRLAQRTDPRYLPVIVLSSRGQDAVRALQAGAADYVTKPWEPEELRARVHTYVQLRRREVELGDAVERLNQRTRELESEMSERRRAEAQLVMASRMSAVGVVAAGVAHEINNPLTYLIGNLDLLRSKLSAAQAGERRMDLESALRMAEHASEGAERVRLIVRDLKAFSRPDTEELEPVNLVEVLESVLRLAGHELKHRARIVWDRTPVPPVVGNAARLSQVLLNVVANAAQAMGEGEPEQDVLHIVTRVLEAEGAVEVRLRDTGVGMDKETLSQVFELFFTTKRKSAGTGLGLSLCRKIVEGFGGRIDITSELGRGTEVVIRLPCYAGAEAVPEQEHDASDLARTRLTPAHRVLVVDDEPEIGTVVAAMLQGRYAVEVARDGRSALALLGSGGEFDAVLCDLMMEGTSGMDVYETIVRERPALASRFVFMTGGPCTARASAFLEQHEERVLEKPFTLKQLTSALASTRHS
jgi:signal transduction histidine kinase